jgi:hypothetical protein
VSRTDRLSPLQQASKRLLGKQYRVEIGAWIYRNGSGPINPTQMRKALELICVQAPAHTNVSNELEALAKCKLLEQMDTAGEAWFERRTTVFFRCCQDLLEELDPAAAAKAAQVEATTTQRAFGREPVDTAALPEKSPSRPLCSAAR